MVVYSQEIDLSRLEERVETLSKDSGLKKEGKLAPENRD